MFDKISNNKSQIPIFWYLVLEICDLFKLRFLFIFGINYKSIGTEVKIIKK